MFETIRKDLYFRCKELGDYVSLDEYSEISRLTKLIENVPPVHLISPAAMQFLIACTKEIERMVEAAWIQHPEDTERFTFLQNFLSTLRLVILLIEREALEKLITNMPKYREAIAFWYMLKSQE